MSAASTEVESPSASSAAVVGTLICEPRACPECKRRRVKCSLGVRPCHNCADKAQLKEECLADGAIHKRSCLACKQQRKYCDRRNPCSRCVKKGIPCKPSWNAPNANAEPVLAEVVSPPGENEFHHPTRPVLSRVSTPEEQEEELVDSLLSHAHSSSSKQQNQQHQQQHQEMLFAEQELSAGRSGGGNQSLFQFLKEFSDDLTPAKFQQGQIDQDFVDLLLHPPSEVNPATGLMDSAGLTLSETYDVEMDTADECKAVVAIETQVQPIHYILAEPPRFWNSDLLYNDARELLLDASPMALLDVLGMPFGKLFFWFLCFNQVLTPQQVYSLFKKMFDIVENSLPMLDESQKALLDKRVHLLLYQNECISEANKKTINPVGSCVVSLKCPNLTSSDLLMVDQLVIYFKHLWAERFPEARIPNPGVIISKIDPETGEFLTFWDEMSEEIIGCRMGDEIEILKERERRDRSWMAAHGEQHLGPLMTGTFNMVDHDSAHSEHIRAICSLLFHPDRIVSGIVDYKHASGARVRCLYCTSFVFDHNLDRFKMAISLRYPIPSGHGLSSSSS